MVYVEFDPLNPGKGRKKEETNPGFNRERDKSS